MAMLDADLLIVGSGAGAGPLALRCAQAGFSVLLLEKGPDLADHQYRADEFAAADGHLYPDHAAEPRMVVTRKTPQGVRLGLGWSANCVGGGTVHMGGFLYRFFPEDFRSVSVFGPHAQAVDWPLDYADLEPWYGLAEAELGVSGCSKAGTLTTLPPRSSAYPMPPLKEHPFAQVMDDYARARGLQLMVTPRSVNSIAWDGRPACVPCDACAGHGCRIGAKNSVQRSLLARAQRSGRVRLLSGCRVTRIEASAQRVEAVHFVDASGQTQRARARLYVLSATAIESARLLLHSSSAAHPAGIGNAHDQVGRHLQFHATTMGAARFDLRDVPQLREWQPFLGRTLIDHYRYQQDGRLHKGGLLRFDIAGRQPLLTYGRVQRWNSSVLYGEALAAAMREHYQYTQTITYEAFHDFFPNAHTRLTLDPELRDAWDVPVARIALDVPPSQAQTGRYLAERAHELLADLGARDFAIETLGGTASFLTQGTCRFGTDPRHSVLDLNCKVHGMDNLHVVDGSFMPTSGGAPPTLTILAMSFRVAAHLCDRLRAAA